MNIAIIIPTYNLEEHIARCLDSISKQTVAPDEVIIIDDGSTDSTIEIAKNYPFVTIITQENSGPAVARNNGVNNATSEWISFLDGDDEFLPTKIEELKKLLFAEISEDIVMIANDQEEGALGGSFTSTLLHKHFDSSKSLFSQLFQGCFLSTASLTVRRSAFLKVGGMDASLPSAQDYDTWLRLADIGGLVFIKKVLTRCVEREGSISFNVGNRYICLLKIVEKHISRTSLKEYILRVLKLHYEIASMYGKTGSKDLMFRFMAYSPVSITRAIIFKLLN